MTEHSLLLDMGVVLLCGFTGAWLASRLGQSVIVGYVVLGTVIGPNLLGLIKDADIIHTLAELGIVFLMFFLGLEFSVARFAQIKNSALVVGSIKIAVQLGAGLILGLALGWSDIDRYFLAGIMAISSSGVTAKILFDLRRTATRSSEVLMGVMVFEDFVAVVFMGALIGIASSGLVQTGVVVATALKVILFYAVAIVVVAKLLDKLVTHVDQIESDELFVALAAGCILLAGAGATLVGLPSAAGAFVLGMIINHEDIQERIRHRLSPFRDVFLVVFFLAFGMQIDPAGIVPVLGLLAAVVAVSLTVELVISSSLTFLGGLPAMAAVAVGTGLVSRGEYAMIYATIGLQSGAINPSLYQLTGVYVLTMTLLAPLLMRNARKIKGLYSALIPSRPKKALMAFSTTVGPLMYPDYHGVTPPSHRHLFVAALVGYLIIVLRAFGLLDPVILTGLAVSGIGLVALMITLLGKGLCQARAQMGVAPDNRRDCRFVQLILSGVLVFILLGAVVWGHSPYISYALILALILFLSLVIINHTRVVESQVQSPGSRSKAG